MKDLKIIASDRDLICLAFVSVHSLFSSRSQKASLSVEKFSRAEKFPLLLVGVCAQLSFLISDRIIILTGIINL